MPFASRKMKTPNPQLPTPKFNVTGHLGSWELGVGI
jgi:hypothetical protein